MPVPRTMKPSTINSSNSIDLSNITSFSLVSSNLCENLTDFIGRDVLAEQSIEYRWDTKNITCLKRHAPELTSAIYLKVIVLAIISVLSLVGNLATIYSITKNRRKQHGSTIYLLIFHLSVADLLVTIFCLAGEAIWSYTVAWLWGNAACKIFKFLQMFSLYLSTFVLVLIGVDRFVAVRYPMKGLNTPQTCSRFVLLTWLLSFILATPQVRRFCFTYFKYEGIFISKETQFKRYNFRNFIQFS
ncbi:GNRR2 protein, partial [Acromyrmex insinuator]